MRIVQDRAAGGRELVPALFLKTLVETGPFVLSNLLASDPRYVHNPALDAAQATGPAHLLKVVKAHILSGELLVNVYQLHGSLRHWEAYQNAESVSSA